MSALLSVTGLFKSYGPIPVLRDVNLDVAPGETLALVGATGSGKSTAAGLLARFYDVQDGAVRIGGIDVRELVLRDLRQAVAFVPETTFLFSDTVFANVAFARPEARARPSQTLNYKRRAAPATSALRASGTAAAFSR